MSEDVKGKSGVYSITSPTCGVYVGQARDIGRRWQDHRSALVRGNHSNEKIQRAFDERGSNIDSLRFEVLSFCSPNRLNKIEQSYIDSMKPQMNIALVAGSPMLGRKHSDETKKRMSDARRGKPKSEAWRRKLSKSIKASLKAKRLLKLAASKSQSSNGERFGKQSS